MKKFVLISLITCMFFFKNSAIANYEKVFFDFNIESITGEMINFENYKGKVQVVGVNDLGSIEANAHLIKYDSTHGTLNQIVKINHVGAT